MVRSNVFDPSDPEDLPPNALFPHIPDIYAHKASTPLRESELDLLEKWLPAHETIQEGIVDLLALVMMRHMVWHSRKVDA